MPRRRPTGARAAAPQPGAADGVCDRERGYHPPVTERGAASEAARVCPFVALDDDRDRRLDRPDHRHRCFAEGRPEPRALAHQEAFCLSPSFPGCPVFQDWARREAARPTTPGAVPVESPVPTVEDADLAAEAGAATLGAASASAVTSSTHGAVPRADEGDLPAGPWDGWTSDREDEADPGGDLPPRRAQPRDWAEPPAWGGTAGAGAGAADAGAAGAAAAAAAGGPGRGGDARGASERDATPPPFLTESDAAGREAAAPAGRSGSGSGAGGAAGGSLAAASGTRAAASRGAGQRPPPEPEWDDLDDGDEPTPHEAARRRSIAAGRLRDSDRGDTPPWERPRRSEAYPALKSPMSIPRLGPVALAAAALVLAAFALFFIVPNLLNIGAPVGVGGGGPESSAAASARASAAASPSPATPAAPTPQVYVIKQGDTLSKIAKKFGITVDELLAANTTTIKDPNKIGLGQQIVIPVPGASGEASPAASPSPSA
jgi:LysM repeat protein